MAKEAFDKVPLALSDGTEVILKPLVISRLKDFMKAFQKLKEVGDDEIAGYDVFITMSGIALASELKEQFPEGVDRKNDDFLSEDYREYLEETLEMDTIYKVLEVCAGMKLNDPNLLRAVAEAQAGMS